MQLESLLHKKNFYISYIWRYLCYSYLWKCVLWSDESMFQLVLGKNRHRVLSSKDERDHPDFHQRQVQKQTSVLLLGAGHQYKQHG